MLNLLKDTWVWLPNSPSMSRILSTNYCVQNMWWNSNTLSTIGQTFIRPRARLYWNRLGTDTSPEKIKGNPIQKIDTTRTRGFSRSRRRRQVAQDMLRGVRIRRRGAKITNGENSRKRCIWGAHRGLCFHDFSSFAWDRPWSCSGNLDFRDFELCTPRTHAVSALTNLTPMNRAPWRRFRNFENWRILGIRKLNPLESAPR